jgi:hypothetical protein
MSKFQNGRGEGSMAKFNQYQQENDSLSLDFMDYSYLQLEFHWDVPATAITSFKLISVAAEPAWKPPLKLFPSHLRKIQGCTKHSKKQVKHPVQGISRDYSCLFYWGAVSAEGYGCEIK